MFSGLAKVGGLSAFVLLVGAAPAEAFGRRQASSCYFTPAHCYSPCYSYCLPYCPPCYPPWPQPVYYPWDCVCNETDKVLRVHITSGYGHFETILYPGYCAAFHFIKDNKPRVLSAFTLDNTLVDLVTFSLIDQTGDPYPNCFPIIQSQPAAEKAKQRDRMRKGDGNWRPTPSGQPF